MLLFLAGCTPAYRPNLRLASTVVRPSIAVLLITVDGMSVEVLDPMLANGELPHIAALAANGVRARTATGSLPSLTYPNLTTILTGQEPARHGILGNKWFDRAALVYRDYTTAADYRRVDDDFSAPTVFEQLGDDYGVSVQCAVRRGAGRIIDNWAAAGLRWVAGAYEAVDQLMPMRFDIIAEEAGRRGRWPAMIHVYFPGADEIAHRHGRDSARYRGALVNIDRQIGLMAEAVAQAGMAERTCTILVSDHNHTPVPGDRWFDVAGWLRRRGFRVLSEPSPDESWEARRRRYERVDAVVATGGDRMAAIHLRGPGGWHQRPTEEQIAAALGRGFLGLPKRPELEAVAWSIRASDAPPRVFVESVSPRWDLSHQAIDTVATAVGNWLTLAALPITAAASPAETTAAGFQPDMSRFGLPPSSPDAGVFVDLAELFRSPRAGDVVLFAADGWDFAPGGAGGHGGLGEADTRVPMIFSGSMIDRGAVLESARLADVTPTILGLLGKQPVTISPSFDGRDLSRVLTAAGDAAAE